MAKLNNRPRRPAAQGLPKGCRGTVQDRWEGGSTSSLAVRVDFRPFEGFERLAAPGLLLAVPLTSVVATGLGSVRGVAECSTAALLSQRAARCVACRRPRHGRLVPPWPKRCRTRAPNSGLSPYWSAPGFAPPWLHSFCTLLRTDITDVSQAQQQACCRSGLLRPCRCHWQLCFRG